MNKHAFHHLGNNFFISSRFFEDGETPHQAWARISGFKIGAEQEARNIALQEALQAPRIRFPRDPRKHQEGSNV